MYPQVLGEVDTLCTVFIAMDNVFPLQKVLPFFSPSPGDLLCYISRKALVQGIHMKWPLSFTGVSLTSWIPAALCWDDSRVNLV